MRCDKIKANFNTLKPIVLSIHNLGLTYCVSFFSGKPSDPPGACRSGWTGENTFVQCEFKAHLKLRVLKVACFSTGVFPDHVGRKSSTNLPLCTVWDFIQTNKNLFPHSQFSQMTLNNVWSKWTQPKPKLVTRTPAPLCSYSHPLTITIKCGHIIYSCWYSSVYYQCRFMESIIW